MNNLTRLVMFMTLVALVAGVAAQEQKTVPQNGGGEESAFRPPMKSALEKLREVPVDIEPIFPLAK